MKRIALLLSSLLLLLTECGGNTTNGSYEQITQEAAKLAELIPLSLGTLRVTSPEVVVRLRL